MLASWSLDRVYGRPLNPRPCFNKTTKYHLNYIGLYENKNIVCTICLYCFSKACFTEQFICIGEHFQTKTVPHQALTKYHLNYIGLSENKNEISHSEQRNNW